MFHFTSMFFYIFKCSQNNKFKKSNNDINKSKIIIAQDVSNKMILKCFILIIENAPNLSNVDANKKLSKKF